MAFKSMVAALCFAFAASVFIAGGAGAQSQPLVTEEMMVKSPDPGIEIFVRNKRPANMTSFRPERTVLFVHGATYPAHAAFDLKLDGQSWMDYIASRGYDVYLLDIRGYGKSTRPKEMAEEAAKNPPVVRGETAVKDIGTVVDFILARRNIARLNLLGWSWGSTLMATYTSQNAGKVNRLALYAPPWIRQTASLVQAGPGPLAAYRTVRRDQALGRWMTGVPEDKKAALIPAGWFDAWADATFASDPDGAKHEPAGAARAERRGAGRRRVLRRRQAVLRSGQDHGADAAGARRMGPRHAALHGADAVPAAGQRARQALHDARRRHAHDHDGKEPPGAVQGGAGHSSTRPAARKLWFRTR